MVEKNVFIKVCEAFEENMNTYKEIDAMLGHSYRSLEYYKKAVKPIMRIFVKEIAGQETLDVVIYEDDWGKEYMYDMVMRVIKDYFDNEAKTVVVSSSQSPKGQCHVSFAQAYNSEVIYDWLSHMDPDKPETLKLPVGPVVSGYDIINNYMALEF